MDDTSKTKIDLGQVDIAPLDSATNRAEFCCGNNRIDNFFRNNSKKQHLKHQVRVYVAKYCEVAVGYYYLVAATHIPAQVCEEAAIKYGRVNSTPCVYLGMLGVNKLHQSCGIGQMLMAHAMETTLKVADLVGIYALTLDAVDQKTSDTYERWGFQRFIGNPLSMYIPITTIRCARVVSN